MTTNTLTLTDFLLARIDEDETAQVGAECWCPDLRQLAGCPARVVAECEAKRRIIEFHESWPVLVETPPAMEQVDGGLDSLTFRASQQIAWLTEQEYRARFGDEPPAAPVLRHMAAVYADHPDYREEWRP